MTRFVVLSIILAACGGGHNVRASVGVPDAPAARPDPTRVDVAQGILQGFVDGPVVRWNGIPYAAPPVGPLRWRPPAPPQSWSGIRDSTLYANECAQAPNEVMPDGTPVGDENCLYLNVIAPAGVTGPMPVIVFVHGGAWITGDSTAPIYNATHLPVNGPAIIVTINYRLGALGFLALPQLAAEDEHGSTGDYGLLDQQAALQWVHDNIAAFGGDPSRVVFWGQSAGGASTLMQLASPLAHGLFQAILAQSGGGATGRQLAHAETIGGSYAASLGCQGSNVLACLRALPAAQAEALPPTGYQWGPVVDGYVLPQPPPVMFAAGTHNHMPVVIGTTALEYANPTAFAHPQISTVVDEASYEAALAQNFGSANVSAVLVQYPAASYASPRAAYVAALSDADMTCPARRMARSLAATQTEPVFRYLFTHTDSAGQTALGPAHGVDFPYWFDAFLYFTPDAQEQTLAAAMSSHLLHLSSTAAPTNDWPRYDAGDPTLILDDTIAAELDPHGTACDSWDLLATP
jgi:para-nitrobenzyl esterase